MLQDDIIELKEITEEDVRIINKMRNNWLQKKMTLGVRYPITLESDLDWYEQIINDRINKNIVFVIQNKEIEKTVGLIQLSKIDWISRNAYIGIQLVNGESGKGLGFRSVKLIIKYGFEIINLNKIVAEVASYNIASLKLFEKLNFIKEGCLKNHIYYENRYSDLNILSRFNK